MIKIADPVPTGQVVMTTSTVPETMASGYFLQVQLEREMKQIKAIEEIILGNPCLPAHALARKIHAELQR